MIQIMVIVLTLCLLTGCGSKQDIARPLPTLPGDVVQTKAIAFAEQLGHTNVQVMQDLAINPTQQLIQVAWPVNELSSEIPVLIFVVDRATGAIRDATEDEMKKTLKR